MFFVGFVKCKLFHCILSKPKGIYYVTLSLCQKTHSTVIFSFFVSKSPHIKLIPYRFWSYQLVSGWMWNVSLQASILDKESKLYLLLLCSKTAHLFYFRELKKILKQIMRKTYTVLMNRKVTGHYFFAEKERKKIYYTNKPQLYNDLKESCYYLVLFFKSFFFVMSVMKSTWE